MLNLGLGLMGAAAEASSNTKYRFFHPIHVISCLYKIPRRLSEELAPGFSAAIICFPVAALVGVLVVVALGLETAPSASFEVVSFGMRAAMPSRSSMISRLSLA